MAGGRVGSGTGTKSARLRACLFCVREVAAKCVAQARMPTRSRRCSSFPNHVAVKRNANDVPMPAVVIRVAFFARGGGLGGKVEEKGWHVAEEEVVAQTAATPVLCQWCRVVCVRNICLHEVDMATDRGGGQSACNAPVRQRCAASGSCFIQAMREVYEVRRRQCLKTGRHRREVCGKG